MIAMKSMAVDRFYDEDQRVRNPDDEVFQLFSKHCLDIVKGRLVRAASKCNLHFTEKIGRTGESRSSKVTDVKSLILHYTQLTEVTKQNQETLYYIFYDSFDNNWDFDEETNLMMKLQFVYDGDMKSLGVQKGDVAKCFSSKKQDQIRNIRKAIIRTHPELNIQVRRVDEESEYDRRRRELGIFYVKPTNDNKVSRLKFSFHYLL